MAKVLVIARHMLPDNELSKHINNCDLSALQNITLYITSADFDEVFEECRVESPDLIIDLSHDLDWSCGFLTRKSNIEDLQDIPYVCGGDPARLMILDMCIGDLEDAYDEDDSDPVFQRHQTFLRSMN